MKALLEVLKLDVMDVITTSNGAGEDEGTGNCGDFCEDDAW